MEISPQQSSFAPHKKLNVNNWTIQAELPVSLFIKSSENLLDVDNHDLLELGYKGNGARRIIFVDQNVYNLYGDRIENYFNFHKIDCKIFSVKCLEEKKDLDTLFQILNQMEEFKLRRVGEPVFGIGGGVLLDIVGLAATLYRRGVPYVRIPTTLLALIDASIGVKTGINHFGKRNRLGSYYAHVAAYLDRSFLKTVPKKELINGCGEILKMAVVKDQDLFCLLEEHGKRLVENKFQEDKASTEIINRSIQGMIEDLEPNLWEKDMKRLVNFGHSFSPFVEMNALPEISHGEAVALDVLFSCILSNSRGLMKTQDVDRIFSVTKDLGLPIFHPLFADVDILKEGLEDTVRHRNGAQELPLPLSIGSSVFFNDITTQEIANASNIMKNKQYD